MRRYRRSSERFTSLMGRFLLVLGAALLASCERTPEASRAFNVIFAIESDPGLRLRQARVLVDGESVGETDSNGLLRTTVHGRAGQQLRIEHDCPEGHATPSEAKLLRLRSFASINEPGPRGLEITLRCRPMKRRAAFVVRAKNGAGLPVLLDGKMVARTNGSGVAHFSVFGAPGTEYIVELDTQERPLLRPQQPTHLRTLPDADEIFLLDQSFEVGNQARGRGYRRTKITKIE